MRLAIKVCTFPNLDGHFVLGEGSAPKQLIDAVDGKEPCDVGTQTVGHCHPHSMSGNHLSIATETFKSRVLMWKCGRDMSTSSYAEQHLPLPHL